MHLDRVSVWGAILGTVHVNPLGLDLGSYCWSADCCVRGEAVEGLGLRSSRLPLLTHYVKYTPV